MKRPIAISLAPNLFAKDSFHAFKLLFSPFSYFNGTAISSLEQWFRYTFKVSYAVGFNSGRSSLSAILKVLNVGRGDEVILQAFTCVPVPNAIVWQGARPVYVDINNSFTIDTQDLERKITRRTKAIIVQHTYGIPTDMEKIISIAKKKEIPVIEDCAHVIGYTHHGKKLGTWGDIAFFSFGREKVISSTFGGMVITNNLGLGKKLRQFEKKQHYPSLRWTLQQLLHPVAFFFILPLYNLGIGKVLLIILQKIHFLSFPITQQEKRADKKALYVRRLPNALASLSLFQLRRLSEFNSHRKEISKIYLTELGNLAPYKSLIPFLWFPLMVDSREYVLSYCKDRNIHLRNWFSQVVDPKGVDLNAVYYRKGMCPNAEKISKSVINLPTYPTLSTEDAKKVVRTLKECIQ